MKHENPRFLMIGIGLIVIALFFMLISFLLDPFGASFYYSAFIGGSFIWASLVTLDMRTHLDVFPCKSLHARAEFIDDQIMIIVPRSASFLRGSGALFSILSLGLAPWLFPGVFLPENMSIPLWHLFSLFIMFPCFLYIFFVSTVSQIITLDQHRTFIKREVNGLGWGSKLMSVDPNLDIDVHKHDHALEFIVSNVDYSRKSIFGSKKEYFKEKRIQIPETRNIQLDELIPMIFPEQKSFLPLMFDLISEPRYNSNSRTARAREIRKELTIRQKEFRKNMKSE